MSVSIIVKNLVRSNADADPEVHDLRFRDPDWDNYYGPMISYLAPIVREYFRKEFPEEGEVVSFDYRYPAEDRWAHASFE